MPKIESKYDLSYLLKLYPDYDSVLGPYERADKRTIVVLNNTKLPKGHPKKTYTISYPKAIMECKLKRRLDPDTETVDHINGDKTDNRIRNLRIMTRSENVIKQWTVDYKHKPRKDGKVYRKYKKKIDAEIVRV